MLLPPRPPDPAKALALAAKAKPDVTQSLGASALLLAGEAYRTGDAAHGRALLEAATVQPFVDEIAAFWQKGMPAALLDHLPLDAQAAVELARSRFVGGDERAALVKKAAADDVLHGPVTVALERWPAP